MTTLRVQGRDLTEAHLAEIRQLQIDQPGWSRCKLSIALAERWNWRNDAGRLKDMAARTLMLKLCARGLIELPPPKNRMARRAAQPPSSCLELFPPEAEAPLITGPLGVLRPLSWELAATPGQRLRVRRLIERHHYLGYAGPVGENAQYLVADGRGRDLAVMVFGAAAWKAAARDQFIGWSDRQRAEHLRWIANQQRFLILPWVRVPHLASHLLAAAARRLSADWLGRYGHPIWLLETFVQRDRFAATCYKAAGWIEAGQTTGRTRQDRNRTLQTPVKSIWLRPLHHRFRSLLTTP